jgi:hypothetical protein
MITKLREKHYAITYLTSSELVREFTTWTIDSKKSPSDNFLAIYTVRTKAHRHSRNVHFDNRFTWNTFLAGLRLREAYKTLIKGFGNTAKQEYML